MCVKNWTAKKVVLFGFSNKIGVKCYRVKYLQISFPKNKEFKLNMLIFSYLKKPIDQGFFQESIKEKCSFVTCSFLKKTMPI